VYGAFRMGSETPEETPEAWITRMTLLAPPPRDKMGRVVRVGDEIFCDNEAAWKAFWATHWANDPDGMGRLPLGVVRNPLSGTSWVRIAQLHCFPLEGTNSPKSPETWPWKATAIVVSYQTYLSQRTEDWWVSDHVSREAQCIEHEDCLGNVELARACARSPEG